MMSMCHGAEQDMCLQPAQEARSVGVRDQAGCDTALSPRTCPGKFYLSGVGTFLVCSLREVGPTLP